MNYWHDNPCILRKSNNISVTLCALLRTIRIRHALDVSIGKTQFEFDRKTGNPTGKARTWLCFSFEKTKTLKCVTYKIENVFHHGDFNVVRFNTITGTLYGANNQVLDILEAINFEVCVDHKTGETRRIRPNKSVVPCKYRQSMEDSPCKYSSHKMSGGGGGGGGGGGVGGAVGGGDIIIEDPLVAVPAPIETIYLEKTFVSADDTVPQALFVECGITPYSDDPDQPYHGEWEWRAARRRTIRYLVSWSNKLGIVPYVMWHGISYWETLATMIMDLVEDMAPGETLIIAITGHGFNSGVRGQSSFSVDNGYFSTRTLNKIFRSAPEGSRIVFLNEHCHMGSSIFGGGPYDEYTVGTELDSDVDSINTVLTLSDNEKSTLEGELDQDGSDYITPTFEDFHYVNKDWLSKPTFSQTQQVSARISNIGASGNNNQYFIQLSASPFNRKSYFEMGDAASFLGSIPNSWLEARAEYEHYLKQYPDDQYIDDYEYDPDAEPGEQLPVRPRFKYRGTYLDFFMRPVRDPKYPAYDRLYIGLGIDPWIGINQTYYPEFLEYCGLDSISYSSSGKFFMHGFTFMDWFNGAAWLAKHVIDIFYESMDVPDIPKYKTYPTISWTPKVPADSDALGRYEYTQIVEDESNDPSNENTGSN